MSRTFLHVDMDAFFAAVEQHDHPQWRGKPVVVGAGPNERGVVAAASYEARPYGIHSAMPSREAGRLCPHAVFVPPNGRRYEEVSRQIRAILERFTPLVEPVSIDEAFMDVTGVLRLFGDGREVARKIKAAIRSETGLTASVGVAPNKFLAKLASDLNKPDGLTVVPWSREEIVAFLAPMSISRIWGVGKVTQATLEQQGLRTMRDLQSVSESRLASIVGRSSARHLLALARGEDDRTIELENEEKSISREYTFSRDSTSREEIRRVLGDLVDDVGSQLRAAGKYAELGRLKLRWQGFKTITRQRLFARPVCDDFSLREMAEALFAAEELVKPVRLIGFGVSRLTASAQMQLTLFDARPGAEDRKERLSRAVDQLRRKLGPDSIGRAAGMRQAKIRRGVNEKAPQRAPSPKSSNESDVPG